MCVFVYSLDVARLSGSDSSRPSSGACTTSQPIDPSARLTGSTRGPHTQSTGPWLTASPIGTICTSGVSGNASHNQPLNARPANSAPARPVRRAGPGAPHSVPAADQRHNPGKQSSGVHTVGFPHRLRTRAPVPPCCPIDPTLGWVAVRQRFGDLQPQQLDRRRVNQHRRQADAR